MTSGGGTGSQVEQVSTSPQRHGAGPIRKRSPGSDGDGAWDTACEETFVINDGTPAENHMRFCHSCGALIDATEYVWPVMDDA
jgi:hypothetical protein